MVLGQNTSLDPRVAKVAESAQKRLKKSKLPFCFTGGYQLNLLGVGRPTMDVDLIVARKNWQKTVDILGSLSVDHERMGLPGEPLPAAILKTDEGVFIEIFPEGLCAGDIAKLRGKSKRHPAGKIAFRLSGDSLLNLITSKLASYLSATDRLKDLADVQELAKAFKLTPAFAKKLPLSVRAAFIRVVKPLNQDSPRNTKKRTAKNKLKSLGAVLK